MFVKIVELIVVDLRHAWEHLKKQNNSKGINLSPAKAKNRYV